MWVCVNVTCMLPGAGGAVSAPSSAQRYATAPDRGRERKDSFRLLKCSCPDRKPEKRDSLRPLQMLRRRKGEGDPGQLGRMTERAGGSKRRVHFTTSIHERERGRKKGRTIQREKESAQAQFTLCVLKRCLSQNNCPGCDPPTPQSVAQLILM